MSHRLMAGLLLLNFAVQSSAALAQGVWIVSDSYELDARGVVFVDHAGECDAVQLPNHQTPFRVWRLSDTRECAPIVYRPGPEGLEFAVGRGDIDATFALSQVFGVIRHRNSSIRLCCHAKSHASVDPSTWRIVRDRNQMPLELIASREGRLFVFQVRFDGRPLGKTRITAISPERLRMNGLTDEHGRLACELPHSGIYGIRTEFVDPRAGDWNGEAYAATHHIATLSFPAEVVPQNVVARIAYQTGAP